MTKIILLNVGTEHALGSDLASSHPLARSGWRHAWFAAEGDIIVSPVEIEEDFLRYVGDTLGFDPSSVSVISRDQLVTDELLLSADLVSDLRTRLAGSGAWTIMPCFHTEGVAELALRLGIDNLAGLHFAAQRGGDLFNRKTHFRQLAAGARLPLAEGSIARTPRALAKAIQEHLPRTGTIIVKQDNAAGGMGNITLTKAAVTPLPGSRETWRAHADVQAIAANLWEQLAVPGSEALVVESYHTAAHRFYFEYFIGNDGFPQFLNSGTIRLRSDSDPDAKELVWVGLDIPAELPPFSSANALTLSAQFVARAAQIGYRGFINVDAIITAAGEIIFNETNARWGGGSVLHLLSERLIGERYADSHVLSSLRDVRALPRSAALRVLRERGLHFSPKSKEGVIILANDDRLINTMECLVIGPSRLRVREIENLLREAL